MLDGGNSVRDSSPKPAKKELGVSLARVIRQEAASSTAKAHGSGCVVLEVGTLRVQLDGTCDHTLVLSVIEALRR
jgi:hypothetical protein